VPRCAWRRPDDGSDRLSKTPAIASASRRHARSACRCSPICARSSAVLKMGSPGWPVALVIDQKSGEQVALLRYPSAPTAFSARVAALGRFYNWAFLVPEVNDTAFRDALLGTRYPPERIFSRRKTLMASEVAGLRILVSRPRRTRGRG
jgi:hypothetical protein